jgi:hypothetical protein
VTHTPQAKLAYIQAVGLYLGRIRRIRHRIGVRTSHDTARKRYPCPVGGQAGHGWGWQAAQASGRQRGPIAAQAKWLNLPARAGSWPRRDGPSPGHRLSRGPLPNAGHAPALPTQRARGSRAADHQVGRGCFE